MQEVFLQAYQLQQTRPVRYWSGFLRRLAACRALDRLRQRKANLSVHDLNLTSPACGPEAEAMERTVPRTR